MPERKVNNAVEDLYFGGQCFGANGSISKIRHNMRPRNTVSGSVKQTHVLSMLVSVAMNQLLTVVVCFQVEKATS